MAKIDGFERELVALINRHSREQASNTPDFILAAYLRQCLEAYNSALSARELWYGRPMIQPAEIGLEEPSL